MLPASLQSHRVCADTVESVSVGEVRYAPGKSLWYLAMLAGTLAGATVFSWSAFAVFVVTTALVLLLGHSLGNHRKLVHNSFTCPRWFERVLLWFGVQVGLAGPLGLLRQHDLRDYAQRLPDCHSYLRHGSSFWRDAWWQLHCELRLWYPPVIRLEPAIEGSRYLRWLERTWMLQHLPVAVLFYLWGGWAFVLWGCCARVVACVTGHWLIGYFAHNHGEMDYHVDGAAVQGRNLRWASLLTMGECWHNNHHAYPGSVRLGLAAGQWDPGWWMLCLLRRMHLARDFKLPEDLPPRPELVALPRRESCLGTARSVHWSMQT